jgi:hypothetical protein
MGLFSFRSRQSEALAKQTPDTQKPGNDKKGGRLSDKVNKAQPDRVAMELGNLLAKAEEARDPHNPSWVELYKIYQNSMSDAEVITQRRIAESKLKAEPFVIRKDGKDDEELAKLFDKPWFDKFREIIIYRELFGYRLVEFGQFDEDGQFISCKLFPLLNVYPHNKNIIINETDTAGIPYANDDPEKGELINPYDFFLIELGEPDDLGLLEPLSREVIIKSFSRHDWAEHSEKWGQPRIVVKTDAEGNEIDTIENGVKNFSRNGYAIVGIDDEVEKFEASNNGSGYLIYDKAIDKSDMYIAKIINGQYGTGNEQSFVGTAQVAERILSEFMKTRLRETMNIINYELIPFLIHWGYPLEGASFHYPALEKQPDSAKPATGQDPNVDPNQQDSQNGQKATARLKKKGTAAPW